MENKDYLVRLIAEVSNYFLDRNPQRMVISLHQETDGMHLSVLDDQKRAEKELEEMARSLNAGARPELAEYYGAMGGSDILGRSRLTLVGWQVKHADVSRTEEGTKIDLWLGGDRFDPAAFNMPAK